MKLNRVAAVSLSAAVLVTGTAACSSFETKASDPTSTSSSDTPTSTETTTQAPTTSAAPSPTSSASSSSSSSSSSASSSAASPSSSADLVQGKVGQEVKSSTMSIKVNKIVDPVKPTNEYMTPKAGQRFVAIDMTVKNLGDKPLDFSDFMCINVKTTSDRKADKSYMANYGTDFANSPLQKGDATTGDYNIEVPEGEKVKTIDVRCLLTDLEKKEPTLRVAVDGK